MTENPGALVGATVAAVSRSVELVESLRYDESRIVTITTLTFTDGRTFASSDGPDGDYMHLGTVTREATCAECECAIYLVPGRGWVTDDGSPDCDVAPPVAGIIDTEHRPLDHFECPQDGRRVLLLSVTGSLDPLRGLGIGSHGWYHEDDESPMCGVEPWSGSPPAGALDAARRVDGSVAL